MKIKERWQRFRAGKTGASGTDTAEDKGMRSLSCEKQAAAPSRRLRHQLSGYLPRLQRRPSPPRPMSHDFSAQKLAWRFSNNTGATLGYTTGDATASERGGDGKKGHRRKPSKYPGRCTPPPPAFFSTSPQPMTSSISTWDNQNDHSQNQYQYHHTGPPPLETQIQTLREALSTPPPPPPPPPQQLPPQPSTPKLLPKEFTTTPKKRRPLRLGAALRRNKRTSSYSSPDEKKKAFGKSKKQTLRQRQKEREKQINRHIVTPEQKEHQKLLASYCFPPPPVMTTPTKTGKQQQGQEQEYKMGGRENRLQSASPSSTDDDDDDDDDAGHDGDDEGYSSFRYHHEDHHRVTRWNRQSMNRRKSSNISPCSSPTMSPVILGISPDADANDEQSHLLATTTREIEDLHLGQHDTGIGGIVGMARRGGHHDCARDNNNRPSWGRFEVD